MRKYLAVASLVVLASCSATDRAAVQQKAADIQPGLQAACTSALTLANIAGLVPGVGAVVPYLNVGCATAEGIAKLAADPSSEEWVGTIEGQIKTLASNAGLKLSEALPGTPSITVAEGVVGGTIRCPVFGRGYAVTVTKSGIDLGSCNAGLKL